MCRLCELGADSDVLLSIWQHLPLRLKLRHLLRLCRCARTRQSLLTPAAFAFDQAHVRNTNVDIHEVGTSLATIRVPSFLSHIHSLSVTVTRGRHDFGRMSPHFAGSADLTSLSSSSVLLAGSKKTGKKNSKKGRKQPKGPQQQPAFIGLASLTHLRVLVLSKFYCHCGDRLEYGQQYKEKQPSTAAFPFLPQLETLVLSGEFSKHCLSLIVSIPQQCPQLCFIDLHFFRYQHYGPPPADVTAFSPLLLTFMRWLASVNHTVRLDDGFDQFTYTSAELKQCYLSLLQPPIERTPADRAIEYVQLAPSRSGGNSWRVFTVCSPFRFLSDSGAADASVASAWSAIRVLDFSRVSKIIAIQSPSTLFICT